MSDEQLQKVDESSLNGAWFRHERERIAVGRRPMGERLNVSERQIALLETKNLAVPPAWRGQLVELGFRFPEPSAGIKTPAHEVVAAADFPDVSLPEPSLPEPSLPEPSLPELARELPIDEIGAALVQEPSAPVADPPQDSKLPRGHFLRSRRYALDLSARVLCDALRVKESDLSMVEAHNLVIPHLWLRTLEDLHFFSAADKHLQAYPKEQQLLTGTWLREQRLRKGISGPVLGVYLGVRPAMVATIEVRDWPVPPEWLPVLWNLGFSTQAAKADAKGPDYKAPEALPEKPPSRISGNWLLYHRLRLQLSQKTLGQHIKATQLQVSRCERKDGLLPPEWLQPLLRLGFPVPKQLLSSMAKKLSELYERSSRQPPSASETDPEAPAKPETVVAELVEPPVSISELVKTILEYRLKLGPRIGQSPIQVLAWIAHDLRMAGAEQAFSHEAVRAAMELLLHPRRTPKGAAQSKRSGPQSRG
jgi:hypothetical protein